MRTHLCSNALLLLLLILAVKHTYTQQDLLLDTHNNYNSLRNSGQNTRNGSYCVDIGQRTYCNITKGWTPRISPHVGVATVLIPTFYCAAMLVLLILCQNNCKFGLQFRVVRDTYIANKRAIYYKSNIGAEAYTSLLEMSKADREIRIRNSNAQRPGRIRRETDYDEMEDEEQTKILKERGYKSPENLIRKERKKLLKAAGSGANVCPGMVKKYRSICCGRFKVPNCLRLLVMTCMVILIPMVKTGWDMVDVGVDCFYFWKLESGELINGNITRNIPVNNTILAFAILGALKSTIIAWANFRLIDFSYGSRRDYKGRCAFLKRLAVWIKIMFEDGVELVLEYFYGDKFIVSQPPWWLIWKDSVTFVIYLSPLIFSLIYIRKQYAEVQKDYGTVEARFIYLPCTVVHFLFCTVTLLRIAGMLLQYVTREIGEGCLEVTPEGTLIQTPFNPQCLNPIDWMILILVGVGLVFSLFSVCNFHRSSLMREFVRNFVWRRVFVRSKIFRVVSQYSVKSEVGNGTNTLPVRGETMNSVV